MNRTKSESHALQLMFRLLDAGVIERSTFTWMRLQHDDDCPALRTQSSLDCRCDVEAVFHGNTYKFQQWVGGQHV